MKRLLLLLATTNIGKITEYKAMLNACSINIILPDDLRLRVSVSENEDTEIGNAILKAKAYAKESGHLALADDSGMYIKALDNKPGVQVRRWCGELPETVTDEEWLAFFLKKIEKIPKINRTAKLYTVAAVATPEGRYETASCFSEFNIADKPRFPICRGMPINSLRYIPELCSMWCGLPFHLQLEFHRGKMKKALCGSIDKLSCGV